MTDGGAHEKIEPEERRNGEQRLRNHPDSIVMPPRRLILIFLRSSVSLIQSVGWFFCSRENFRTQPSSHLLIFQLSPAVFQCN